jgi:hypothetical protein
MRRAHVGETECLRPNARRAHDSATLRTLAHEFDAAQSLLSETLHYAAQFFYPRLRSLDKLERFGCRHRSFDLPTHDSAPANPCDGKNDGIIARVCATLRHLADVSHFRNRLRVRETFRAKPRSVIRLIEVIHRDFPFLLSEFP